MPPHAPTTSTGSGRHQAKTSTQTPRGHQKNKLSNSSTASSAGGGSYASESDVEEDFKRRPNRDSIASVQSNRTDVSTQTNGSGSVRETARSRNSWNARPPRDGDETLEPQIFSVDNLRRDLPEISAVTGLKPPTNASLKTLEQWAKTNDVIRRALEVSARSQIVDIREEQAAASQEGYAARRKQRGTASSARR